MIVASGSRPADWALTAPADGSRHPTRTMTDDDPDALDVAAARRGDRDAFDRLVARHQAGVARLLWRFCRQRDEHEELVQEVFIRAWLDLPGYRGRGRFGHWLRQLAVRRGTDYWRRRARQRLDYRADVDELLDATAREPDCAAAVAAGELVHRLLAELSARDRLVLTLLVLEECSVAETAALTGWSPSLVKVQAHRARRRLRRLMEELP